MVHLASNKFSGILPANYSRLAALQVLLLSNNTALHGELSTVVSSCLDRLSVGIHA